MEATSKQLVLSTQSGRLKPDVRLGVAVSEFAQVLDDDRKREFQKMQTAGTEICGRDAIRVTEELNRKSERSHQTWRPYGTKCGKFLDRLQTLANIGDVLIGGSQNIIATSIWCAVRLSLQVCRPWSPFISDLFVANLQTATNFRGYFERLSSLFMKLGTSWELHQEFSRIFPQSEALQKFLCEYLIVLMRLCRKAVVFSNKSLAGQLWSSLGASFESEFRPLQEEMDKWGSLIQYKTQQIATTHVADAEMFRRRDYKQRILHLLSPNQPQHITTWRRHRRKGECKWIYETAAFKSWIAEDASSTLCVSGKLGSGKTVTMANLVAQMNIMQQTCAFFFCTFKEQDSLKARTVLGSIAFHLLDSIPGDDSTWDILSRQEDTTSRVLTSTGIIRLLTDLLPEQAKYVIVFDGLEDCPNDEITEVVHGLRRLMAGRIVLLCYSARSGSTFQRLTAQRLAAKYSISLDEKMHDDEIKAYITEEVARRKQTSQPGLFNDKLIELVEKQLLAGADGMYLWVSLQLDSIFPSQSTTVVTYEQILNLIKNLPKDLPEAFERALEAIVDDRYGNSIMKIVMAARSPLTLDELMVALTVVPGDPVWYATKVPTNPSQLIPLCGGNLLEMDEEDEKVRFIHHSVASHLLQSTKNPRTMLYHFTSQEAEIQSGAICVTFLNMPIFETAITMTRKIDGARLAEEVIGAATHEQPLLGHLAHLRLFKKKDRRQARAAELDIGRLLAEIQATRMLKFDPHCFQDYAVSNWLSHSQAFHRQSPLCKQIWHLWMRLVCSNIQVARPPFQSPVEESWPALSWALKHHHKDLIYAIFEEPTTEPTDGESISQGIVDLELPPPANKYDRSSLGLILVHLFQLAVKFLGSGPEIDDAYGSKVPWKLLYPSLQQLLDLGADPTINHCKNGNSILQMLLATLGCISETTVDGRKLSDLTRALACDKTQPLLRFTWVPHMLQGILEHDNTQIFKTLLSYVPEMDLKAGKESLIGVAIARNNVEAVRALCDAWPRGCLDPGFADCVNGQRAIQLALEIQNKEIVSLLARRSDGLRDFDGRRGVSVPLLKIAVEGMSVEWVKLLLQLGADPNLGYQAIVDEPLPHKMFRYHLQIAAERSQTLKFLTLVRYGADPSIPAFPTIGNIILHRDNRVLMARLKERDFFESNKGSKALGVGSRHELAPSPALLEACKMLALDVNEDQTLRHFGVVQSHDVDIRANGEELRLILLDLVKTTQNAQLSRQCQEGNTALHYLTGGMERFHHEALAVASSLLSSEWARPGLTLPNKYGQTPLHRAIDNGSRNNWRPPYKDSALFLLSRLQTMNLLQWLTGGGNSVLGFAISKGAPIDPLIKTLLDARIDPDATLHGATPLEIAVNMPEFHYASRVTDLLLLIGADPSVTCSNGGLLLDVVPTERRDWLQAWLQRLKPAEAREETTEIYELEDPTTTRLLIDRTQRSQIKGAHRMRSRDSSPARSDTSNRAVCGDGETCCHYGPHS